MKRIVMLFLMLGSIAIFGAKKENLGEKHKVTIQEMKTWEKTFAEIAIEESELEDWYGAGNPIEFMYKNRILNEKKVKFLDSLKKKETITEEEKEKFNSILTKAVNDLPRNYYVKDENIKNPIGLVKYMVAQSKLKIQNPSTHILTRVANIEERGKILKLSNKNDLTEKEVKELRKILNKLIEKPGFYNENIWYIVEISPRMEEVNKLYKKSNKTKREINNVNAKALYIAYSEYFSRLEKWND